MTVFEALTDGPLMRLEATRAARAAIAGLVEAADDPHFLVLEAQAAEQLQNVVRGGPLRHPGFSTHHDEEGRVVIGDVWPNSPAARAGLRPGDVILAINRHPFRGRLQELFDLCTLPEGARIVVDVQRGDVVCVRHELELRSFAPPLVEARRIGPSTGYIKLRIVTTSEDPAADAASAVRRALAELTRDPLDALVLDLRSNLGGYGVTRVASLFTSAPIIMAYGRGSAREEDPRCGARASFRGKIVVLVDESTTSSAEVITLALRELEGITVVGQPSGGALNVPRTLELQDGRLLMVPDRPAVGPLSGTTPDGMRIWPDIVCRNRNPDDFARNRDPQLERALEALQGDASAHPNALPAEAEITAREGASGSAGKGGQVLSSAP